MALPDELYFNSMPWCSALLSDPAFTRTPLTPSRTRTANGLRAFMAETLNTPQTVSAWVSQYRLSDDEESKIDECRVLMRLGSGVNGHPDTCHGGFVAAVLDEVMGLLLTGNVEREGV